MNMICLHEDLPAAAQTDAELAIPITTLTSLLGRPHYGYVTVTLDANGVGTELSCGAWA
jgi:hypothetical protein